MTECERIAALFDSTLEGAPYYGPSMLAVLNVSQDGPALLRPAWARHSVLESVAHMAAEMRYTAEIIEGTAPPWVEGETTWPRPANSLAEALRHLASSSGSLATSIRELDDSALDRETPLKVSLRSVLYGTLHHNAYHLGQIVLLIRSSQAEPTVSGV